MTAAPVIEPTAAEVLEKIRAECRARVAAEDIERAKDSLFAALHPALHHAIAARACLEVDDDLILGHHVDAFFAAGRSAWAAWTKLKALRDAQASSTSGSEGGGA